MKIRGLTAILLVLLLSQRATAAQNIFTEFLDRYRPSGQSSWLAPTPGQALDTLIRDGILHLTVDNAVRLMLESNLNVRVNRYSPLLNQYEILSASRLFEPTLRISTGVSRSTRPTISQLDGASSPSTLSHNYSVNFSQALSTGAGIGIGFTVDRFSSNSVFSTFNPSFSGTLNYAVRQPLLRGRGRDVTTNAIRVAKNNRQVSDVDFELQLIDLVVHTELMYWDLVILQEEIKVQQKSLELARKTLSDNRRQVEVGTLAPIEVVQAEAEVAARQEQMIISSFGNDRLQTQMKQLITSVADPGIVLARLDPVEMARRPAADDVMPIEVAIKYAMESRPEIRRFDLQEKNHDLVVQMTKNSLLPDLSVFASYTQSGIGGVETVRSGLGDNSIVEVRQGGLWNAMAQMFGYNFTGFSAGVSLSIPLSNKAAQSDYSRAIAQRKLLDEHRAALLQDIAVQVRDAHSQVEMNRAGIEAAHKSLELARLRLTAEEKKNQIGVSPIQFVLNAQSYMTAAETREVQAVIHYTQSVVRYDRAVGRTLKKNNIAIEQELRMAED